MLAFRAMEKLPPAILLMGPTASGKTAAAMTLADRFPVELISVDSAQVFIDMNIGTAALAWKTRKMRAVPPVFYGQPVFPQVFHA